ncbi:MAG: sulfatase [Akkermansiaceae bacterium]|nr:sulfatase [Akkermansiaceae bacterium]
MKFPLFLLIASSLSAFAETVKPNFLFVLTDDQRWDAISAVQKEQGDKARFPWLKTPVLDRLKSQGAIFRNSFVTTSLCSPGRASLLTGQYAHTHGVSNNHTPLPADSITYASVLKANGYHTGYIGKWHMGTQPERPGFDFSASFQGQGKFFDCPVTIRKDGEVKKVIEPKWIDDASADHAIGFLRENKNRPFLLTVGFKSVHGPREPHADFKEEYDGEKANPVPNLKSPAPFRPEGVNEPRNTAPGNPKMLDYFRTLTSADRSFGRILDELDALGLDKNTIVIFTSDNGYYLGEHGLGDKRSAYEESLRVPLLIRSPFHKITGKEITPDVLNIDLAPTIVDLAGIKLPESFQGRSLRPLLEESPPADWRESFLYEYFYERNFRNPTILGLRSTKGKIITYPENPQWNELFDLGEDPYETTNHYNNPAKAGLRKELEAGLEKQKLDTGYKIPSTADPDESGKERPKRRTQREPEP